MLVLFCFFVTCFVNKKEVLSNGLTSFFICDNMIMPNKKPIIKSFYNLIGVLYPFFLVHSEFDKNADFDCVEV